MSFSSLSSSHHKFLLSLYSDVELKSFEDANQHSNWCSAMKDELDALELNKTWHLIDCPAGVKLVGCKWVYCIKRKLDGSVDQYKACLVAKGFTQTEGVDFLKIFFPIVKPSIIRLVLALASLKHWPIHQLDINNTFLYVDLSEDVYMTLLPGLHLLDRINVVSC
ncbi:uncharacterized protein LOC107610830 [Arachis ipaensis]|uniref:uncharacterized protein LOC107610830 n=1 Tax=Arachis ipaensis TaxID=130454 RepID=UPI0007AF576C|nr:uncharacterized protein LOC107610830 [Arachis ipaensis]XP_025670093.1 uncharacterized protein LOC112769849 [Arachis hypogaea]